MKQLFYLDIIRQLYYHYLVINNITVSCKKRYAPMALTFLCGTLGVHTQIFQSDRCITNIMCTPHQCVFFHLLTSLDHQSNQTCEVKCSFILTFYFHSMLLGQLYCKQSFICYQLSKDGRVSPHLIPPSTSYRPLASYRSP